MPPKSSNKKSAVSWFHCEICDVNITSKERETHDKDCPIADKAVVGVNGNVLEYVRDGQLYTASVERHTFNVDELKDMPAKYLNQLVFMSEGAMRLAHFHIGQPVVIKAQDHPQVVPFVRCIWPVPEKFLTTLFLTDADYKQCWLPLKGSTFTIYGLSSEGAVPAKAVHLQLQYVDDEAKLNETHLKDVERLLKHEFKELIFTHGSSLYMNFFNKALQFKVIDWNAFDATVSETPTLEQSLDNLCISTNERFFKITSATSIAVRHLQQNQKDVEAPKHFITKIEIGGLDTQIQLIEESMEFALGFRKVPKGVKTSRGLLLYGSTGCGKSMICDAMCALVQQKSAIVQTQVIRINTSELFSKFLGETEKNLTAYFEKAFASYPQATLIIIEDVNNLCPKHETNEVVKRVAVAFNSMLDTISSRTEAQRIFVIATTSQIDALNGSVRRCGRLDTEVEVGAPTPQGRAEILQCLLRKVEHCLTATDVKEVAQVTHGFVGADLANLVYSASLRTLKSSDNKLLALADILSSLTHIKPSAMREVLIENPNVHWTDIGGQAELKMKLKQAIEWPLLHPDKFKRLGIKPPRGILMFGPPGCSKTMIAKALATESQLNFLSIKGPELFSMWVGESERAVREVFRKARQVAPAIVFFDEIDAIGGERAEGGGSSGSSVKERVLTQLLTEMDGVEALENVTIVAATNRPDMIDKALLRPGRIDRIVYVGLPDAEARREIFRIKLRPMPIAENVQLDELVRRTDGYSGAEIQAICHEAALKTLEQSFDAQYVTWQEFEYALNAVQPRTSADLLQLYENYLKKS